VASNPQVAGSIPALPGAPHISSNRQLGMFRIGASSKAHLMAEDGSATTGFFLPG
jgi:hypothetical protein